MPAELPSAQFTTAWSVPRVSLALILVLLLTAVTWWVLADAVPTSSAPLHAVHAEASNESFETLADKSSTEQPAENTLPVNATPPVPAQSQHTASSAKPLTDTLPTATTTMSTTTTMPTGFSRIVLTAQMEKLEPGQPLQAQVDRQRIQRLYLFTELRGYAGQQLLHRWWYQGELQTEVLLTIEDSPWRTYSEKWLLPAQTGLWRVEILDQAQNVLYQHDFQYQ